MKLLEDALCWIGIAVVIGGIWYIYMPFGIIAVGCFLVWVAYNMRRDRMEGEG